MSGTDTADYGARTGSVGVKIDDVANDGDDVNHDGLGLEEQDNVHTDIETVRGGSGTTRWWAATWRIV